MSGQVYLNPTRLSILSIPRDKVWIFSAAILQLLHQEAQKTPHSTFKTRTSHGFDLSEDFLESDDESEDADISDKDSDAESSKSLRQQGGRKALKRTTTQTDNSSKCGPSGSSSDSLVDVLQRTELSDAELVSSEDDHHFFHIAYTPTECTVIYPTQSGQGLFDQPLAACKSLGYGDVVLLEKAYLNLQVDSEGEFNNSAKILQLTEPLSQHHISLFFLSTHFTNIVLIPYALKEKVIDILSDNDFVFSDVSNSYILAGSHEPALQLSMDVPTKTAMKILADAAITPQIHRKSKLLLTGARPGEVQQSILKASQTIATGAIPGFFAITRSSFSEVSLILPGSSRQRAAMGFDFRSIIGSSLDIIIPIVVDLSSLSIDTTGIVAGLASTLWEGMRLVDGPVLQRFDMNYLSMARSAVVMVPRENLAPVIKIVNSMESALAQDETA